jgi:hypothetical protein
MTKKNKVIYVSSTTQERLKALKYDNNESYDQVINKLLNVKLDSGPITYNISNNKNNIDVLIDWDAELANITYIKNNETYLMFPEADYLTDDIGEWNILKEQIIENQQGILNVCAILDPGEEYPYGLLKIYRY